MTASATHQMIYFRYVGAFLLLTLYRMNLLITRMINDNMQKAEAYDITVAESTALQELTDKGVAISRKAVANNRVKTTVADI